MEIGFILVPLHDCKHEVSKHDEKPLPLHCTAATPGRLCKDSRKTLMHSYSKFGIWKQKSAVETCSEVITVEEWTPSCKCVSFPLVTAGQLTDGKHAFHHCPSFLFVFLPLTYAVLENVLRILTSCGVFFCFVVWRLRATCLHVLPPPLVWLWWKRM